MRPGEEDGAALVLEQAERLVRLEHLLQHDRGSPYQGCERNRHQTAREEERQVAPGPVLRLDAAVLLAVMTRYSLLARRVDRAAALLAVPEVAWTAYATVLSTAVAAKNSRKASPSGRTA